MGFFNYSSTGNPALAPDDRPWSQYILEVLKARETYQPGMPETNQGPLAPGFSDPLETLPWLYPLIADIKPYVNPDDPGLAPEDQERLRNFVSSAEYSAQAKDHFSIWGDQFFPVLIGLGLVTGAAGAYGAYAAPAAEAGAGAGAASGWPEFSGLLAEAGGPTLTDVGTGAIVANPVQYAAPIGPTLEAGGAGGFLSTLGQVAPYASGGGTGLGAVGSLTDNQQVSDAGTALSTAGALASGTTALDSAAADQAAFDNIAARGPLDAGSGPDTGGLLSDIGQYARLAGPLVSGVSSIVGGINSANAAKDAAQTQADAARQAQNTLLTIFDQNRADLAPYRMAGYGALADLTRLTGAPLTYGPYTATGPLDPTAYAFQPPTGEQVLHDDPGYAFRVEQGQRALERSAAAKGMQLSGGQLKDLSRFSQGLAAQEYQAAYGRRLTQNQLAYERARTANEDTFARNRDTYTTNFGTLTSLRNTRYNELAGLSGTGQTATNTTAQLGANTGTQLAANTTSAGAALGAGTVGAANALNAGITGVGNAVNQYNQLQTLNTYYNTLASLASSRRAA